MSTARSLCALGIVLAGCSSTGVGNPGVASLTLTSDPTVEPAAADATNEPEQLPADALRHAIVVFGELRFLACDTSEADARVSGRFVVDLATNKSIPPIPSVPVPESGFCGIDATLAPALEPPALAGRSMFFSGVRSDGTLFLLFADMPGTLRMRPLDNTVWPLEPRHAWLWALRPRRWVQPSELEGVDSEPLDDVSRVIPIDVDRHRVLYTIIRERVAGRSTLHEDLNDNRQVDASERRGSALLGQGLDSLD
jgi:hypothetical protein